MHTATDSKCFHGIQICKLIEQVCSFINIDEASDLFAYQVLYSISRIAVIDLNGAHFVPPQIRSVSDSKKRWGSGYE